MQLEIKAVPGRDGRFAATGRSAALGQRPEAGAIPQKSAGCTAARQGHRPTPTQTRIERSSQLPQSMAYARNIYQGIVYARP
jgi:hypothetical protein